MEKKILEINKLKKSYGERNIVSELSFDVARGEILGLLGPNGAGKTTAFYMVVGLIRPDAGNIYFKGEEITAMPMHKRATMGMGYLAQEPSIFRQLTVEENILCILETLPLSKSERKNRLDELLTELRLEKLAKKRAVSLSGGERRRLEITRALVTSPQLLLLDEPFANIDPVTIGDVQEMVRHLVSKGISVLITDHNAREIFSIAPRALLIREGRVFLAGSKDELLSNEEARRHYFGNEFKM